MSLVGKERHLLGDRLKAADILAKKSGKTTLALSSVGEFCSAEVRARIYAHGALDVVIYALTNLKPEPICKEMSLDQVFISTTCTAGQICGPEGRALWAGGGVSSLAVIISRFKLLLTHPPCLPNWGIDQPHTLRI